MPGYGYSGKPRDLGWGPVRIAQAWDTLMKRLGYQSYVAQGGDWGAVITDQMGVQAPAGLLGIHTNMAGVVPADVWLPLVRNVFGAGGPPPSGLSEEETRTFDQLNLFFAKGAGYGVQMGTRPQTMYGLADSPVTLAAWMINHDPSSYSDIADAFAGHPVGDLTRDEVLDNVTFYWLTNTGVSSARLYWENKVGFFDVKSVSVPAAVSVFPHEIYKAPRSWAERAYPKLIYFNELDRGNHFAAWQEPGLFAAELRAALPVPALADCYPVVGTFSPGGIRMAVPRSSARRATPGRPDKAGLSRHSHGAAAPRPATCRQAITSMSTWING